MRLQHDCAYNTRREDKIGKRSSTRGNMTILSNSWAQHLTNLAGIDKANSNMTAFTHALLPTATLDQRINNLTKEIDATVLFAGPNNMIFRSHSWAKFGGTQSRPNLSIACLAGTGPRAIPVIVYHTCTIASATITTPLVKRDQHLHHYLGTTKHGQKSISKDRRHNGINHCNQRNDGQHNNKHRSQCNDQHISDNHKTSGRQKLHE